jgi:Fe-S cluster assembly ATPase SufC
MDDLVIRDLHLPLDGNEILKGISFSVPAGEAACGRHSGAPRSGPSRIDAESEAP